MVQTYLDSRAGYVCSGKLCYLWTSAALRTFNIPRETVNLAPHKECCRRLRNKVTTPLPFTVLTGVQRRNLLPRPSGRRSPPPQQRRQRRQTTTGGKYPHGRSRHQPRLILFLLHPYHLVRSRHSTYRSRKGSKTAVRTHHLRHHVFAVLVDLSEYLSSD